MSLAETLTAVPVASPSASTARFKTLPDLPDPLRGRTMCSTQLFARLGQPDNRTSQHSSAVDPYAKWGLCYTRCLCMFIAPRRRLVGFMHDASSKQQACG